MNILILSIGKSKEKYLQTGVDIYLKRLKHYVSIDYSEIKDVKAVSNADQLKIAEGRVFLNHIEPSDQVILLDERGKQKKSIEFAQVIEQHQLYHSNRMVFVIGGAFGFSDEMYDRSNQLMSLSKMTFSHQMIRLFFVEQLYRAFTITKNEKYHNE